MFETDTIVAQATPPGRGGVSIVRLSGPKSLNIASALFKKPEEEFKQRFAEFVNCYSQTNEILDEGLSLYFKDPNSFTGEDVVEFQCHGSPVVVDLVIRAALVAGARLAQPGEFSERAFLNGKIDLLQAEAIADLIDSQSGQAAKNAIQTLKGVFSEKITNLNTKLINVRTYLEAAIDFPDEEGVDFISEGKIKEKVEGLIFELKTIQTEAEQGHILQEGMNVVLAGEPNAGKSSLLNCLSQRDSAIVTEIAGTTRDVLKEQITIDGLILHIIDTAGLRKSDDVVEQEGIRRAWNEIENADLVLYLVESHSVEGLENQKAWQELVNKIGIPELSERLVLIENKIDLRNTLPAIKNRQIDSKGFVTISLSAKKQEGIGLLKEKIVEVSGLSRYQEGKFAARRRHLDALSRAQGFLNQALNQLTVIVAAELVAEDLRLAQQSLGEITGEFSPDDLLGSIFSSFCIGK